MISVFIKQTSSVECQRVAQLVGNVKDAQFQHRAKELYTFFFPNASEQDIETIQSDNLTYDICTQRVEVTVLSASNLPKKDLFGSVDPFCRVSYASFMHQSEVRLRNYNPVWDNQPFLFDVPKKGLIAQDSLSSRMEVTVLDWDRLKSNDIIGNASIPDCDLSEVLNAPEGYTKELEVVLSVDGNSVCNTDNIPSIIKIRLKNIGGVISGCEIGALKKFFLNFDVNGDGQIDENEFTEMLRKILPVTMLFTGTESGDSILQNLSPAQVRALLEHKWIFQDTDLDDSLIGKLKSILSNIHNEQDKGNSQLKAGNISEKRSGDPDDQIGGQEPEIKNILHEPSIENDSVEIIEVLNEQLKALAHKLQQYGLITLPPLIWGASSEDTITDSPESIAIRYLI
jgi:hypothetical protein